MKKVIFPGTFDPPTLGHLNIIQRTASIFDFLYVAIGDNRAKKASFSVKERADLLKQITASLSNVEVIAFDGLLVDCAAQLNATAIIRSIRNLSDFENETMQMHMNRQLGNIETLYMVADEKYKLISSTLIKEIASHGRRLQAFVPAEIEESIFQRLFHSKTI